MNIHLIRSEEVPFELIEEVRDLINHFPGPVRCLDEEECTFEFLPGSKPRRYETQQNFETQNKVMRKRKMSVSESVSFPFETPAVTWDQMFKACETFRKEKEIPTDDQVVLLTDLANDRNWFSSLDPSGKNNAFVQSSWWDHFLEGERKFPITYEVASKALLRAVIGNNHEMVLQFAHEKARGCISDLCMDKRDITLKLRTGDICRDCLSMIEQQEINPHLVHQVLSVFDGIRFEIAFKRRYIATRKPSRLEIKGPALDIHLSDLNDLKMPLNPQEKAVFLTHLLSKDGLTRVEFHEKRNEILELYKSISKRGALAQMTSAVDNLVNLQSNHLNEKCATIKRKFEKHVGKAMAENYTITGPYGERKKIDLPRELITGLELVQKAMNWTD